MSATERVAGERCRYVMHGPGDTCDCKARLAQVVTHTRTSTNGNGPDYCAECSAAISEWVTWPCAAPATPDADDASESHASFYGGPDRHEGSRDGCRICPAASTDASGALSEAERERSRPAKNFRPDVLVWTEYDVERIVAARESAAATRARDEEREAWSSWLDGWSGTVGPRPPTVEAVASALREGPRPFGTA